MKKILIFILVGMLMLTGCSFADNTQNSSKEDTKSAISSTQNTDKADKTETTSKETPNWPKAKESDIYKVEVVAENLDIGYVFCDFTEDGYAIVAKDRDNPESLCAYMDTNGRILGKGFVYREAYPFDEKSGLAYVILSDETQAYINKNFEVVLKETDIDTKGIKYDEMYLEHFNNGYAVVTLECLNDDMDFSKIYSGIINAKGKLTAKFEECYYTNNGDGTFSKQKNIDDEDSITEIVNEKGKTINKLSPGEEYRYCGNGFRIYYTEVRCSEEHGNCEEESLMGLMDEKFNKITDKIYHYDPFLYATSDLVCVKMYDTGESVFINSKGKEKFKIDGIVDATVTGNIIIASKDDGYDYIYDMNGKQTSFIGFSAICADIKNEYCIVNYNEEYEYGNEMIVDVKGDIIYRFEEDNVIYAYDCATWGSGCFLVNTKDGYDLIKVVKK